MSGNPGNEETIRARRRRQGASAGPQSNERAQPPARRRPGSQGGNQPTGGGGFGGGGAGGGGLGGGGLGGGSLGGGGAAPRLPLWLIAVLVIGFFLFQFFFSNSSGDTPQTDFPAFPTEVAQEENVQQPAVVDLAPTPTRKPAATRPASSASAGQTWTIMLYQDADDKILEQDIYLDLNEAERVGSSDQVQIVAQVDRFKGGYSGDRDWTSTRRYHITQDDDLQSVRSELVQDMGELNMADGATLSDFVSWAASAYPADKYVLILSDHGMGWPGGFSDPDPVSRDASRAPLASALGQDQLFMMELESTLDGVVQQAGIGQFEIIGLDACLMSHIEVLSGLEPYARYAVLSQETEPSLGWAYASFLQELVNNPGMDGAQLSSLIVKSYIQDDQRINDPQARAEFLRQGSPTGGLFGASNQVSAATLSQQLSRDVTLTAIDLSQIPALIDSLNTLSYSLQSENQDSVASARNYAPSYTNIFGRETPSPYIDLGSFALLLKRAGVGAQSSQAVDQVIAGIQNAVVAEKHGEGKRGSTGISIYFPNSTLYRSPVAGPQSYTTIARRFSEQSLWDDYLVFFYNDVSFQAQPVPPATSFNAASRAPGLGNFEVGAIQLSDTVAAPDQPVLLTSRISGQNIGYIYLFVGIYDPNANAIFKADMDYLESPKTLENNGVFYPQWGSGNAFNLEVEWEPTVFQITDGNVSTVALFTPREYGQSAEETLYTVDGIYTYADGNTRSAVLYFRDGVMRQVFGYTDDNHTGGVREIIPQAGDTFTILEQWLDLDTSGQVVDSATQEGAVLTFGSEPFRWEEVYAAAGDYVVGFIVEDMDGNTKQVYTTVTVQ